MKNFFRSLVRIRAIAEKEWIQTRRDTRSLIIAMFTPALLIILFGYALSLDVKDVKMAVYDQDRSSVSRQFIEKFSHTDYLTIYSYVDSYDTIDSLVNRGKISMALVVPRGFEKRFKAGKDISVQLLVDGSDASSAIVSIGYVKAIIGQYNLEVKMVELRRLGISSLKMPVDVKNRIWYNPELLSKNFIIPGLVVLILAIVSALIASLTISREWERGTMETLITTPVRSYELVIGKLLPYLFIGVFDIMIALLIGYFVFDVPFRGSFIELTLVSLLFLTGTSSMGIMISSATRVQVLSVQIAVVLTYLPSFILSGFIFPIENMPPFIQGVTYFVPARYLMVVSKGIIIRGVGASLFGMQILFLFIFAVVVTAVSLKKLSLRLPEDKQ
jgi:ABC-2 type transport system permease protein